MADDLHIISMIFDDLRITKETNALVGAHLCRITALIGRPLPEGR
jgi:hypothetical protein